MSIEQSIEKMVQENIGIETSVLRELSTMNHEGEPCQGSMIIVDDIPNDGLFFFEPIEFKDDRLSRRLLQMSSYGLSLIVSSKKVNNKNNEAKETGWVQHAHGLSNSKEWSWRFEFQGPNKWTVKVKNYVFSEISEFVYSNGSYLDIRENSKQQRFIDLIKKYFFASMGGTYITEEEIKGIWSKIYSTASVQPHGTLLIITDKALEEAQRLHIKNRAILMQKKRLVDEEFITAISSIDGAVLLDPEGLCHGIGAILDGKAVINGERARGSRFNSSLNYIGVKQSENDGKYMALVFSEDRTVDMFSTEVEGCKEIR